ncbi:MAG TPA: hypothetical protein VLA16_05885 [Ideonella sp.]|nr:hypothetical protein [Ideonella sp.]
MSTAVAEPTRGVAATARPPAAGSPRRRLYLFTALPPQRNGLADYILEYIVPLARDHDLSLVSESGHTRAARAAMAALQLPAEFEVIDEAVFMARQPESHAQMFYNIGNNGDCAYMLDYMHRYPGVVIVHDISLFYLHQETLHRARANGMLSDWMAYDGHTVPTDFIQRDGSLHRTPGTLYQECLMVRRIAETATGLMLHSRYAEFRFMGGAHGVPMGSLNGKPVALIPHFVLPPAPVHDDAPAVLQRFGVEPGDFVMLVPGFLTGNKMLYEVLAAYQRARTVHADLKLIFAGEERASEYAVSEHIAMLWPAGDGPTVTGYLSATDLDILLGRADLSFVLRYPTYGETSGILPRAVMGGGRVVTVTIGSYPEFESPLVDHVSIGTKTVAQLEACILRARAAHDTQEPRAQRRAAEAVRAAERSPSALYPRVAELLRQAWEIRG